jgi:hypothetical protein
MPEIAIRICLMGMTCLLWGAGCPEIPALGTPGPIRTYYVRYDLTTLNHRLAEENLIMIPAEQDFRAESFSVIFVDCVIPLTPKESENDRAARARDVALKHLLKTQGLPSVSAQDLATILSYEGFIRTPIQILGMHTREDSPGAVHYTARVQFAALAFPDRWQGLETRSLIQKKLEAFLKWFE